MFEPKLKKGQEVYRLDMSTLELSTEKVNFCTEFCFRLVGSGRVYSSDMVDSTYPESEHKVHDVPFAFFSNEDLLTDYISHHSKVLANQSNMCKNILESFKQHTDG